MLPLADCYYGGESASPQTDRRRMIKSQKAKDSLLCVLEGYGVLSTQSCSKLYLGCRVQGLFPYCSAPLGSTGSFEPSICVGSIFSFCDQPDAIMELSYCSAPLGSTVAFTPSIGPHPPPIRACAKPQAGVSPRRGESRV